MKNIFLIALIATSLTLTTTSCKKVSGDKATVGEAATVAQSAGTALPVDVTSSIINWEGAKPTATHTGTIRLSGGEIQVEGMTITGGEFTIDMNSITDTDLKGDMKTNLENHLKGLAEGKENDFFNVSQYPTSKFEITKITQLDGDEKATHLIYGNLTIKDVTKEVGFKAHINVKENEVVVTTPPFTINRTLWGINFMSKTVFDGLGDKFVNDDIGLTISLKANKVAM